MSHDDRNRPRWPSDPKQSRSSTKPELSGLPVRPHPHLTPHRVALALQADFAPADWRQLTTHCPACKEAAATLESWSRMLDHPDLYVACEQASVPALLEEVLALEQPGRLELIETHGEFRSWGLCCELIRESFEIRFHDPDGYRDLAAVAVAISRRLDEGFYRASLCADLRARALANAANAHRILGHLHLAEEVFAEADGWLARGSGRPRVLAEVLCLRGSLERAQRRHANAEHMYLEAFASYQKLGDRDGALRAQVSRSNVLLDRRQLEAARDLLLELLPGLRASRVDAKVRTVALYNLATACLELDDAERFDEVIELLPRTHPLCVLRRDGLLARRLARRGQIEPARAAYRKLIAAYLLLGHGFDAAETSCELIRLDLEAHDSQAARIHAQEMIEVLQDDRVRGPAAQALVRFARLAKTQDPEISLVEHLHEYLAQARRNPELEWQPETPTESTSSA